jgi:hypothetical protein
MKLAVRIDTIEQRILLIRGEKVIVDADLAEFYGVRTKRLNEQVRRHRERFPEDFMFRLTSAEKAEVVAKCDHLASLWNMRWFYAAYAGPQLLPQVVAELAGGSNSARRSRVVSYLS